MRVTQAQREAKATFWKRAAANPLLTPDKIKDADIRRLSPGGEDLPLASRPFREWFLDKDAYEVLLESSKEASLKLLIDKVNMSDAEAKKVGLTHAAQINAAKVLLDKSGIGETKVVVADTDVNNMSEEELEAFIAAKQPKPKLKGL